MTVPEPVDYYDDTIFLLLTSIKSEEYYGIVYMGNKCIHQDFLHIPDMFHMDYLIENYIKGNENDY